jgi:glycogen debranching enzyme
MGVPNDALPPESADRLREQAKLTLRTNDTGTFVKPGTFQYPHQWNWDAALVALGLSTFDLERARLEVRALLRGQWKNGMIPHVVYHDGPSDYFPTPDFWQIDRSPDAPEIATSGIVQPPLLATCVRMIHDSNGDAPGAVAFLSEVYDALVNWHSWLHETRDPRNRGLVALIHPWESGTDNAARWVEPLVRVVPTRVPEYNRKDFVHVKEDERPVRAEYERYIHLIRLFREWSYDPETIFARSPFLVQDVLFNALVYRGHADLRAIARILDRPTEEIDDWMGTLRYAFNNRLWDDDEGLYFSYDLRGERVLKENGIATFMPLFAGLANERQAHRLVEEHLLNKEEYAPNDTQYWVPSQAKNNFFYEPRRYWRGPVWIVTNWMIIQGLKRYGYVDLADRIRRQSLELMQMHGFVEYYDPRDGSPCGATGFSWSAALALEMLQESADK